MYKCQDTEAVEISWKVLISITILYPVQQTKYLQPITNFVVANDFLPKGFLLFKIAKIAISLGYFTKLSIKSLVVKREYFKSS